MSNYKIKINDKEYGLHWGMGAIEIYCDSMGVELTEGLDLLTMPNKDQTKATVTLVLAAAQNECELSGQPFDLTYRQLQAYFDDAPDGTMGEISLDFMKSKYLGKTMYEHYGVEDPGVKKKSPSGKSLKSATKSD